MTPYTLAHPSHPPATIEAGTGAVAAAFYAARCGLADGDVVTATRADGWTRDYEVRRVWTARQVLTEEERTENQRRCAGVVQAELFGGEG